jgi:hypothetical protein
MEQSALSVKMNSVRSPLAQKTMLGLLFFLISMGLGYPTLSRYDPRSVPGLFDSIGYYSLVTGGNLAGDESHRVLVPDLAKPIYWLVNGRLHTWNPISFALLAANSIFIATTAILLVEISDRFVANYAVALLSGFIYLANFAIANFNLAGYVDSSMNCMLIILAWTLLTERWWLLPLWGVVGALGKETFVPLAAVFAFAWWLTESRATKRRLPQLWWVGAMIVVGFITLGLLMSRGSSPYSPLSFAVSRWEPSAQGYLYFSGLIRCLKARETLFVFGWLLPLGIWRLRRLPKTWVVASICAALAALAMGAYDDAEGNVVRPLFSSLGPVLSLSASILLAEMGAGPRRSETFEMKPGDD